MKAGDKIGPFKVLKELGSGAMGTVYKVVYDTDGQIYALKIISMGLAGNETAIARFEREYTILKQLKHPNIVRRFASGRYKGTPFFAMEYVQGDSLDVIMSRRVRFSWEEVVEMGKQICAALKHAHDKGIIHRDLKPSNLMRLDDGTIKLTDFGIAKDVDMTALTGANATVGTAAYMSPEQCRGEPMLTLKSDLYSLGVVFFELLTGRKPFLADSPVDMFMKHVNEPPPRPSRLIEGIIPIWLDTLVLQMLEKKPEHRPRDAEMVAKSLDEVIEKVNEGASAAVDAANARAIDRRYQTGMATDEDRDVARALRSLTTGKKKKKKGQPWYAKAWVKAIPLLAGLVLIAGAIWFLTRPASADELYQQAEKMMQKEEHYARALARIDGKDGPIREFLYRYPADPRAEQVKKWEDEAEVHPQFKTLMKKVRDAQSKKKGDSIRTESSFERAAVSAIRFDELGDLVYCWRRWAEADRAADTTPEIPIRKKVAQRGLRDINAKLEEGKVRVATDKDEKEYRVALLKKKLEEVTAMAVKDPQKARDHCDEIEKLYDEEDDAQVKEGVAAIISFRKSLK